MTTEEQAFVKSFGPMRNLAILLIHILKTEDITASHTVYMCNTLATNKQQNPVSSVFPPPRGSHVSTKVNLCHKGCNSILYSAQFSPALTHSNIILLTSPKHYLSFRFEYTLLVKHNRMWKTQDGVYI